MLNHDLEIMRQLVESRRIYSAIYESSSQEIPGSLLVTSAAPAEGKTTLAAGLGILASENSPSQRNLLIDLNWYNPSLHKCFNFNSNYTLDDLVSKDNLSDLICDTEYDNLKILPAPRSNGSTHSSNREILAAGKELIEKADQEFDHVILDSAAMFPMNRYMMDPVTVGAQVDSTLLVVMANSTRRSTVKRAKMTLQSAKINLCGLVMNHQLNPLQQHLNHSSQLNPN